ncbi:hypothetical protein CLAFUW4_02337 [Fulvia fulva]|uniref:Uncharacterized protein n=1 Tax=Passalora fulva TaxID=5499 RepID=A0A9Q8LAC6_PASFU|nr:uncharacterized protein CLAFUR5_02326 [Fulvia fulva]KAK4631794.1 hypothetical protein CLAFUR4_02332 [Fulvia fulva]KAK4633645.1 hypothetical protein CLAFUR0_02336 [Fulvia fulva]UJO13720.1 hypothetical protein CLAFUR5_02326 [Fulvia fulva]WPV11190.1 hypothetical protein CLAFUW4_02337 [Fulvia fulva]WPV25812.1 hypothetical protein CLAFUW7_02337 [Fulvia fulva]
MAENVFVGRPSIRATPKYTHVKVPEFIVPRAPEKSYRELEAEFLDRAAAMGRDICVKHKNTRNTLERVEYDDDGPWDPAAAIVAGDEVLLASDVEQTTNHKEDDTVAGASEDGSKKENSTQRPSQQTVNPKSSQLTSARRGRKRSASADSSDQDTKRVKPSPSDRASVADEALVTSFEAPDGATATTGLSKQIPAIKIGDN